jgi:hypothetical protein
MVRRYRTFRPGLTLIELVTATFIGLLTIMTVGIVLHASQRNWVKAYNDANRGIEIDALLTMVEFGSTGRQSNKSDYYVYQRNISGSYVPATVPNGDPSMVATGNAVEFRYWDVPLNAANANILRADNRAPAYRFFYQVGNELRVDQGAIDADGHRRTTGVTTQTLSRNVRSNSLRFNHTIQTRPQNPLQNPVGGGSVRMEAVFEDPDGSFITVRTATLLRNVWPLPQQLP